MATRQPTSDTINTITGTFTGHDENQGSIVDWTGIAGTFVASFGYPGNMDVTWTNCAPTRT